MPQRSKTKDHFRNYSPRIPPLMALQQRLIKCQNEVRSQQVWRNFGDFEDFENSDFIINADDERILARSASQMSLNSLDSDSTVSEVRRAPSILRSSSLRSAGRGKAMTTFISAFFTERCNINDEIYAICDITNISGSESSWLSDSEVFSDLTIEADRSPTLSDASSYSVKGAKSLLLSDECCTDYSDSTVMADTEIEGIPNQSPISSYASSDISEGSERLRGWVQSSVQYCTVIADREIEGTITESPTFSVTKSDMTVDSREDSDRFLLFDEEHHRDVTPSSQNSYQEYKWPSTSKCMNKKKSHASRQPRRGFHQNLGGSRRRGRGIEQKSSLREHGPIKRGGSFSRQTVGRGKSNDVSKIVEPSFEISLSPPPNENSILHQPLPGKSFLRLHFMNPTEKPIAIGPAQSCYLQYK